MLDSNIDILPPTVGEQLKSAREAKNYTIAEVAAQLRLTREVIRYLETGNWDELHGRAYARGYFVSYVDFLGLDQDELLVEFNAQYKRSPDPVRAANPHQIYEKRRYSLLPFIILALVLLLLWFAFEQRQPISNALEEVLGSQVGNTKDPDNIFKDSVVQQLPDDKDKQQIVAPDDKDKQQIVAPDRVDKRATQ